MLDSQHEFELDEDYKEQEPHVDERWLVSYADMMTLLFGFFVLLYSMSDKFDVIQQAAQSQFNNSTAATNGETTPVGADGSNSEFKTLLEERRNLTIKVADLEMQLKAEKIKTDQLTHSLDAVDELRERIREQEGQIVQHKAAQKEIQDLRAKLAVKDIPPEAQGAQQGKGQGGGLVIIAQSGNFVANVQRITLSGITLSQPPPPSLGTTFQMTLRRENGETVEVTCYAVEDASGHRTNRLAITDFPNNEEQKLRDWFTPR